MKISEIIMNKYKLRMPPTVYYDLLEDVVEVEDEQEPKAKAFDVLRFVADNAGLSTFEAIEKAYNMGASEQEPILDKIRAEIEKLQKMCDKNDLNLMAQYSAFGMVLDILDKYKAESEG